MSAFRHIHPTTLFCMLIPILLGSFSTIHPIKMSSVLINCNGNSMAIETHFFADDFERSLNSDLSQRYNLTTYYNNKEVREAVDRFTSKYLKLKLNGLNIAFSCSSAIYNKDANLFTFYYKPGAVLKKKNELIVDNTLLMNFFSEQKNLLIIKLSGQEEKTFLFEKEKTQKTISF